MISYLIYLSSHLKQFLSDSLIGTVFSFKSERLELFTDILFHDPGDKNSISFECYFASFLLIIAINN